MALGATVPAITRVLTGTGVPLVLGGGIGLTLSRLVSRVLSDLFRSQRTQGTPQVRLPSTSPERVC